MDEVIVNKNSAFLSGKALFPFDFSAIQGMSVTIATRRTLLIPYTEAFESDFLVLNYCAKNRA